MVQSIAFLIRQNRDYSPAFFALLKKLLMSEILQAINPPPCFQALKTNTTRTKMNAFVGRSQETKIPAIITNSRTTSLIITKP
jgi:hypothetical protein